MFKHCVNGFRKPPLPREHEPKSSHILQNLDFYPRDTTLKKQNMATITCSFIPSSRIPPPHSFHNWPLTCTHGRLCLCANSSMFSFRKRQSGNASPSDSPPFGFGTVLFNFSLPTRLCPMKGSKNGHSCRRSLAQWWDSTVTGTSDVLQQRRHIITPLPSMAPTNFQRFQGGVSLFPFPIVLRPASDRPVSDTIFVMPTNCTARSFRACRITHAFRTTGPTKCLSNFGNPRQVFARHSRCVQILHFPTATQTTDVIINFSVFKQDIVLSWFFHAPCYLHVAPSARLCRKETIC